MTIAVDLGRKATKQTKQTNIFALSAQSEFLHHLAQHVRPIFYLEVPEITRHVNAQAQRVIVIDQTHAITRIISHKTKSCRRTDYTLALAHSLLLHDH